ncbi:HAMP domain-containing sensor histidine kinase [Halorubrum sp. RMP-47]|uniref:sensor histidine kinase n=1 Tax=Halorubrum miltondacostae TaxID=3076378 RepID=UPI003528F9E3
MSGSVPADDTRVTISPTDHTAPALSFTVDSERAVVTAANEPFLSLAPDPLDPTNTSVTSVLNNCLSDPDAKAVERALVSSDPVSNTVRFTSESDLRHLCHIGTAESAVGHLVFVNPSTDESGAGANSVGPDTLTQAVSHDLRNPLDVARAHLQASMDVHPDDEHLESVQMSHNRMEQIIEDVLTLARGTRNLDPTDGIDLTSVLTDAWESVATANASLCVSTQLPTTTADRRQTKRLFENLIRNSIEHGAENDEDLFIEAGRLGNEPGFYVADDGVGVPSDERTAVFEAGHSGTDHGTGLGLAIVDRIAVAHGWTVSLSESETGGARIEIRLDETEVASR